MINTIKSQVQLDNIIKQTPMAGNIYYDADGSYKDIDWTKEYIKIVISDNITTLERINYGKAKSRNRKTI